MFTASLALLREKIDLVLSDAPKGYTTKDNIECMFDSGRETTYIPIYPHVGAKLLHSGAGDKHERDYALAVYDKQKRASEIGLGPRVGAFIDGFYYGGHKFYGYFTEAAEVVFRLSDDDPRIKGRNVRSLTSRFIADFADKVHQHKLPSWDIYAPNIGFLGDRLVVIDFGN